MAAKTFLPAATLAALLAALALAGCGGSPDGSAVSVTPPEASASVATPTTGEPLPAEPGPAPVEPARAETVPAAPEPLPADVACEEQVFPAQAPIDGTVHYEQLPAGFAYNSIPASQGPHHPQWLIWNWYEVEVPEINKVHNLEHGGIAVQYGDRVDAATVERIRQWYADDPNGIIVAPLAELGNEVAIVAWYSDRAASTTEQLYQESTGHVLTCTGFDQDAFDGFKDEFRGNGPEPFPVRLLKPGTDGSGT